VCAGVEHCVRKSAAHRFACGFAVRVYGEMKLVRGYGLATMTRRKEVKSMTNTSKIMTNKSNIFDMAKRVSESDASLRNEYSGQSVDDFAQHVRYAFQSQGIRLTREDLDNYVRSVASGKDYRFVVAY
jgi:hypothetical protein